MENSGNWIVVREKSGKVIITILQLHDRKILPHFKDIKQALLHCFSATSVVKLTIIAEVMV